MNDQQFQPNGYDLDLAHQGYLARRAIRSATTPQLAAAPYAGPPWYDQMPPNGRPLHHFISIACPAPGVIGFPLLQVRVPNGYKAALKRLRHQYVPGGFIEGSGDLVWRVDVDGAFMPGFDDIRESFNPAYDFPPGSAIVALSGQLITYSMDVAPGFLGPTGANNNVMVSFDGWYAPEYS